MRTRNIALLLGAVLTTGVCFAQQADTNQTAQQAPTATQQAASRHAMNPDKQARHLGKKLGLSRDQVAQIQPILVDRQQQFQTLRADTSLSARDRRSKMRAIQQDSKTKIEVLLNDTQKRQYEQMLADRRSHRKGQQQPQTQTQPGL